MSKIVIQEITHSTPTRIETLLEIDGKKDTIYAEVSENVSAYLTTDRCDAFVVGLMYLAMNRGYDIETSIPITEDLYYNLENHFIDALAHEGSGLHRTKLSMPTIPAVENTGDIVATGVSCGVDCLHTLAVHDNTNLPSYRITHLAFYNVGSHQTGRGKEYDQYLYEGRFNLCKSFAEEYGYTFYTISSNIHEFFERHGGYSHVNNHGYMASFCILLLQKGIKRYYYSAGYPYTDFRVYKSHKNEELDSAMYDLLTFYTISIGNLKVYSAGGNIKRIDKTRVLCSYPPAHKYLNVCVARPKNDGICFKCVRTQLSIDAVGNIDDFKDVFDVESYKRNRKQYIRQMWYSATFGHDELSQEIVPYYKRELTPIFKLNAIVSRYLGVIVRRIKR